MLKKLLILGLLLVIKAQLMAQLKTNLVPVGEGWAGNSINTVIFRKNALYTFKNFQYIAYYNQDGYVILGKRRLQSQNWQIEKTRYKGNIYDAHNSISIIVDDEGFLHVAWNHHNNQLHYAKSIAAGSLVLSDEMSMVSTQEKTVSYPEFYRTKNKILFFYRDGDSGNGNLVINRYDVNTRKWTRVQSNLISGEGKRSAYWQTTIDEKGNIHVSWVWRENPDVASNHDIAYACSKDGGITWEKSDGQRYQLPITASTAEYAWKVPQKSELINQTSMACDNKGNPFIATYWKDSNNIPQYRIIYKLKNQWSQKNLGFRTTPFSLSGMGTKSIPISRPQIMLKGKGKKAHIILVFRDEERDHKISAYILNGIESEGQLFDFNQQNMGAWEPNFDPEIWRRKARVDLFVQNTSQKDNEGVNDAPAEMVYVLEVKLPKK